MLRTVATLADTPSSLQNHIGLIIILLAFLGFVFLPLKRRAGSRRLR
jgi:hypothetical protein